MTPTDAPTPEEEQPPEGMEKDFPTPEVSEEDDPDEGHESIGEVLDGLFDDEGNPKG